MKTYRDFAGAVADFRASGGAMNYCQSTPSTPTPVWQVGAVEEVSECVTCSAREATEVALSAGGLTDEQIAAELADWQ